VFRNCEVDSVIRTHQNDAPADAEVLVGLLRDEKLATSIEAEDSVKLFL
jgi:hypothetical protein